MHHIAPQKQVVEIQNLGVKSLFRFLLRTTNGQNSHQFRFKNAHVALLHSAFCASLVQILAHFRHRTRNLNKLYKLPIQVNPLLGFKKSVYTMPLRKKGMYQFYAKNMNPSHRSSVRNMPFFAKGYVEEK